MGWKMKNCKTRRKGSKAVKQGEKGVGRKGTRQSWRKANRKGSKGRRKGQKGAGVRKYGKERMSSCCNVLYICGIIPWPLFIAAGSD